MIDLISHFSSIFITFLYCLNLFFLLKPLLWPRIYIYHRGNSSCSYGSNLFSKYLNRIIFFLSYTLSSINSVVPMSYDLQYSHSLLNDYLCEFSTLGHTFDTLKLYTSATDSSKYLYF